MERSPKSQNMISTSATSDPLTAEFALLNDLCPELSSLQDLVCRGSWRSVMDKVTRARSLSLLQYPHHHLTYLSHAILALIKLRRYDDALSELNSLEDFDSDEYRYESFPQFYPNRAGSMVPFYLRWLHALIPLKLGQRQEGLDRLYTLLDFVRTKIQVKEGNILVQSLNSWKRREAFVLNSIISYHLSAKEYTACFSLIEDLMDCGHINTVLLSKLGYLQMQVGDIEGTRATFAHIEKIVEEKGEAFGCLSEIELKNLMSRNKALICLVEKDYVSAIREYDECIERDHSDVVAVNNKALCLMYSRDLSDSIKVLENSLESAPTVALNETVVVNLCSMYELAYVNHSDIKKTLNNWIARVAPDDFDSSCTRI